MRRTLGLLITAQLGAGVLLLGLPAAERTLGRADLFAADEVFLTGTGARIVPVSSLDGRSLGTCPGPVTKRMVDAFDAFTRSGGTPFL